MSRASALFVCSTRRELRAGPPYKAVHVAERSVFPAIAAFAVLRVLLVYRAVIPALRCGRYRTVSTTLVHFYSGCWSTGASIVVATTVTADHRSPPLSVFIGHRFRRTRADLVRRIRSSRSFVSFVRRFCLPLSEYRVLSSE